MVAPGYYWGMAKVAISLDDQLYDDAVAIAADETDGNFSALVAMSLRREVQRRAGLALIAEYEAEHGVISEAAVEAARRMLWPEKA